MSDPTAPVEPASGTGPVAGSISLNAMPGFGPSLLAQVSGARQMVLGIGVSDPAAPVRVDARIPPLHRARYRALIAAHGGIALPSTATEQLATFNDPSRALACALAAQTATAELAEIHETRHVAARVALDLGEIEIAERAQAVRGRPVQRVAELISLAREGVVLLTREAVAALPPELAATLKPLPPPEVNPAARLLAGVAVAGWHDDKEDADASEVQPTSVLPLPADARPPGPEVSGPEAVESVAITHGGRTIQVTPADCPFTLGRDRASSLVVGSETASRRHGRIEHENNVFYYADVLQERQLRAQSDRRRILRPRRAPDAGQPRRDQHRLPDRQADGRSGALQLRGARRYPGPAWAGDPAHASPGRRRFGGDALRRSLGKSRVAARLSPDPAVFLQRSFQPRRSTSIFLVSAIALAGFRPLGQVRAQFMMVWQR